MKTKNPRIPHNNIKNSGYIIIFLAIIIISSFACNTRFIDTGDPGQVPVNDFDPDDNNSKDVVLPASDVKDIRQGTVAIIAETTSDPSKVSVRISGENIIDTVEYDLLFTNGKWQGIIGDLPSGADIDIHVEGYDSSGQIIATGNAPVPVVDKHIITVILKMESETLPPDYNENAPRIQYIIITPQRVAPKEFVNLDVHAVDPDSEDELTYHWNDRGYGSFDDNTQASATWTAPQIKGKYDIEVTVTDAQSFSDQLSVSVEVDEGIETSNIPFEVECSCHHCWYYDYEPRIESIEARPKDIKQGETVDLKVKAYDKNKLKLNYKWSSNCPGKFSDINKQDTRFTVSHSAEKKYYKVEVEVCNQYYCSYASKKIKIVKSGNNSPVIQNLNADPASIYRDEDVRLTVNATDADGDSLKYSWTSTCSGSFDKTLKTNPVFTPAADSPYGTCSISVSVSDCKSSVSRSLTIEIKKRNTAPEITGIHANPAVFDVNKSTRLRVDAFDADGDALSYEWSTDCSGLFDNPGAADPLFTADVSAPYGACTMHVEVDDGTVSSEESISVSIEPAAGNVPPEIMGISALPGRGYPGDKIFLNVDAIDENGDLLSYSWRTSVRGAFNDSHAHNPEFTIGDAGFGAGALIITISDGEFYSSLSITINVEKPNIPPAVTSIKAEPPVIDKGGTVHMVLTANDPDGDALIYSWTAGCAGNFNNNNIKNPAFTTAPDVNYGDYSFTVQISDGKHETSESITISIKNPNNQPPRIRSSFQSASMVNERETLVFIIRAYDIEGTVLSFAWSSTDGFFESPIRTEKPDYTESKVVWNAPDCGSVPIVVKVAIIDADNNTTTKDFIPVAILGGAVCTSGNPEIDARLFASDKNAMDQFGNSVAVSGRYAVIGAYRSSVKAGAAYIFEYNENETWEEAAILRPSGGGGEDYFGCSVAIDGSYAVIGADAEDGGPGDPVSNCGAAYIYKRDDNGTWNETAVLRASDRQENDRFGCSVAIKGTRVLVGAKYEDGGVEELHSNSGSVYAFIMNADETWAHSEVLHASDRKINAYFGSAISIDDSRAIIGSYGKGSINEGDQAGSAYIFSLENSSWIEKAILYAPDKQPGDRFGVSVSIYGSNAVIGADCEDGGSGDPVLNSGAAYIFSIDTSTGAWYPSSIKRPSSAQENRYFGGAVSINRRYLLIGSYSDDIGTASPKQDAGAVYIYKRTANSVWGNMVALNADDADAFDSFGISAALGDDFAIVGASGEDGGQGNPASNAGAAYVITFDN